MITLLLKSSFIIIVLLAFYKIFLEKESFFAVNRTYLLTSLGVAFLLPFVTLPRLIEHQGYLSTLLEPTNTKEIATTIPDKIATKQNVATINQPETTIPTPVKVEVATEASTPKNVEITQSTRLPEANNLTTHALKIPTYSYTDWALLIYLFGVVVLSLNLIAQIGSMLFRIIKNADKIYDNDGIIVNMNGVVEPCSFFNYIFINPTSYDFETYEQIIAHEKIHVQKGHTFDLIIAEIAVIALWFNPFIWLFRKEVEKNIEYQTDALLIKNEPQQKEDYQMNLLKIATYNKPLTVVTNYNQSLIKQRILKMNSKQSTPYSYWKYAFIAPTLLLTLLFINKPQVTFANGKVTKIEAPTLLSPSAENTPPSVNKHTPPPANSEKEKKPQNPRRQSEPQFIPATNEPISNSLQESSFSKAPINEVVKTRKNSTNCDALEAAAKAGDKAVVKKLLLNYDVKCLSEQNESQIDNLDLIRDLVHRDAEIYLEKETGNITLRGATWTIWSDARHKAYKAAHNQSNINNPIRHPELDAAIKESNELQAIQIIKNLDAKYLVYQEEQHLAHLKYMKYILNNGGKLTTSQTTVYIKHDDNDFHVKQDSPKEEQVTVTYPDSYEGNSDASCVKLLAAISAEDITQVKALLKNTDVNCIDSNPGYETKELENGMTWRRRKPQTPLVAAARIGNLAIGKLLVAAGAKIDFHGKKNEPPIIATAEMGDKEFTKYLLAKGADLSYNSNAYGSVLNAAARGGHPETMRLLLKAGADIDATTNGQGTPLNAAARNGHISAMQLLIDNGADINVQNNGQGSALNAAARNGHLEAVKLLLDKGANINQQNNGQGSALNAAARHGHLELIELLLAKGADINAETNGQGSALNAAARHGHLDVLKVLLEKGANIDAETNGQGSALNAAARHGHLDILKFLLAKGASIDAQTNGQGSALNAAARHGHLDIVQFLLEKGANIDQQNNGQGSALNAAARHEHLEIVKLLLAKGANVNRMNNGQGTALMQATKNNDYQMVELLLKNGADPYLNPRHQKSPITYAYDANNKRLVNLLKEYIKEH